MRSRNSENKKLAVQARQRVMELLCGKEKCDSSHISKDSDKASIKAFLKENVIMTWVECNAFDKYGRLLVKLYSVQDGSGAIESDDISSILIREHLAYKYEGSTKLTEEEQIRMLQS
jgi:endonuclease YncB( thermonuclease family)